MVVPVACPPSRSTALLLARAMALSADEESRLLVAGGFWPVDARQALRRALDAATNGGGERVLDLSATAIVESLLQLEERAVLAKIRDARDWSALRHVAFMAITLLGAGTRIELTGLRTAVQALPADLRREIENGGTPT